MFNSDATVACWWSQEFVHWGTWMCKNKSIPPESSQRIKLRERRPCARRIAAYLKRWAPSVKLDHPDVASRLSP